MVVPQSLTNACNSCQSSMWRQYTWRVPRRDNTLSPLELVRSRYCFTVLYNTGFIRVLVSNFIFSRHNAYETSAKTTSFEVEPELQHRQRRDANAPACSCVKEVQPMRRRKCLKKRYICKRSAHPGSLLSAHFS